MGYRAVFRCIRGCAAEHPLDAVIYECPACGGLLQVVHDLDPLKERKPEDWKALFDERYRGTEFPYGSGVWGKKEWVAPGLASENVVSLYEGGTPLMRAHRYGDGVGLDDVSIKLCGNSHSGSFKDLGMTVLVSIVKQMVAKGSPIRAIACASTGDTSAALAAYCAVAGLRAVVLLPRGKVSIAQLVQPLANGAQVLALDTDFDGCMVIVKRLAKVPGIYLANSMNSLRLEGQKTVAIEIVQQLGWEVPDFVVIPGGNLGNVSALGAGFLMMKELGLVEKLPRLVVAQSERANPLYRSYLSHFGSLEPVTAQPTVASAIQIGNPVSYERAVKALQKFDGIVEQATEDELSQAAARADLAGMLSCPQSGVALAVLEKLVTRGVIEKKHRTVVVSTAHGLKFTEFKVRYHEGKLDGVGAQHSQRPIELPADYDTVRGAVLGNLDGAA